MKNVDKNGHQKFFTADENREIFLEKVKLVTFSMSFKSFQK